MRCDEVMELMQRNLDGDLKNDEYQLFVDHLSACNECRDLNDRFKQLSFDLEALPKVDPPFSLVDSILPQISLLPTISIQKKSKKKYWVMASSAAAVIAAVLVWPTNSSKPTDDASMKVERLSTTNMTEKNTTAMDSTAKKTTAMAVSPQISTPVQTDKLEEKIEEQVPAPKVEEKSIKKTTPIDASEKDRNTAVENKKPEIPSVAPAVKKEVTAPVPKDEIVAMDKVPTNTSKENEAAMAAPMANKQALQQPTVQDSNQQRTLIASSTGPSTAAQSRSVTGVAPTPQTYVSPDGRLSAAEGDHVILIRNNKTEVLFQSHRYDQVEQVHIYWLDNQQLMYELKKVNGLERWRINLAIGQEQKE